MQAHIPLSTTTRGLSSPFLLSIIIVHKAENLSKQRDMRGIELLKSNVALCGFMLRYVGKM